MKTVQKSLRLPEEVARAIGEIAEASHRDFSSVANEFLNEAVKMKRCPGIYFADTPTGREAHVGGTGLQVWEVISGYKSVQSDWESLREAYHWLEPSQLRAALDYYAAYREEIDAEIASNESWTPERVRREHPHLPVMEF